MSEHLGERTNKQSATLVAAPPKAGQT